MRVHLSAIILATIIVSAAVVGYLYFASDSPGTLFLEVYGSGPTDGSVLQIFLNFSRIQVHTAGESIQSGWRTLMEVTHPSGSCLCSLQYWTFHLPPGGYDMIRLNVTKIVVNIQSVGMVSYAAIGGGVDLNSDLIPIQSNLHSAITVALTLLGAEIHAQNGELHLYGLTCCVSLT